MTNEDDETGRAMSRGQKLGMAAAVVIAIGVAVGVAVFGDGDGEVPVAATTTTSTVRPGVLAAAFADDAVLGRVRAAAEGLEAAGSDPDPEAVCAAVAARLDEVGTIDDLAGEAAGLGDGEVVEAALEQQAAVSSFFAACRGDAPVSVADAAAELVVSNDALDTVLADRGVE